MVDQRTRCVVSGVLAVLAGGGGIRVSLSATDISGFGSGSSITTPDVTATVIGGTASSYAWTKTSGGAIVANFPSSATTDFTGTVPIAGGEATATFVCNVTVNGVIYPSPVLTVTVNRT